MTPSDPIDQEFSVRMRRMLDAARMDTVTDGLAYATLGVEHHIEDPNIDHRLLATLLLLPAITALSRTLTDCAEALGITTAELAAQIRTDH